MYRLEPPDVTGSSLTLGTAGSRRTVYLIDDKLPDTSQSAEGSTAATAAAATATTAPSSNSPPHPDQPQPPSTVLMYNRISNVIGTIGGDATGSSTICSPDNASDKDKKKRTDERENAVWYEYGCV